MISYLIKFVKRRNTVENKILNLSMNNELYKILSCYSQHKKPFRQIRMVYTFTKYLINPLTPFKTIQ
jgi:hypothetical protein